MADYLLWQGLIGGMLIGLGAAALLILNGRIAGISGIAASLLSRTPDRLWRGLFLAGILLGAWLVPTLGNSPYPLEMTDSWPLILIGGFLVGFGTRLGSGCTSGHGVCGLARLARRSIAATLTFMVTAIITVYIMRHLVQGA